MQLTVKRVLCNLVVLFCTTGGPSCKASQHAKAFLLEMLIQLDNYITTVHRSLANHLYLFAKEWFTVAMPTHRA